MLSKPQKIMSAWSSLATFHPFLPVALWSVCFTGVKTCVSWQGKHSMRSERGMNKHKSDWHEEYLFYLVWILWWWVGVNNMNNNNDNRKLQQYWHILIHHSHTYRVFLPGKNVASFVSKCKILFKICLRFVEKFSHFKIVFLCKIVFF